MFDLVFAADTHKVTLKLYVTFYFPFYFLFGPSLQFYTRLWDIYYVKQNVRYL